MDDPLNIERRYRVAAKLGMWFAAAIAVTFFALSVLSWTGSIGEPQDAQMLLVMALGSIVLCAAIRFFIILFAG